MIQTQLKPRLNVTQATLLNSWLFMLTGVWNWAIRKIEHDAKGEIYYTGQTFQNLLAGHGQKIGIPSHMFIDAERAPIASTGRGMIGIDPGLKNLLTLSDGEKAPHPKELQQSLTRLAQAQRGGNRKLTARLHERISNQRKDRNHKLSLRLVQENAVIVFSKDNTKAMARTFGKSVAASAHAQLRTMLAYKSHAGDTRYLEVASRNSTRTCSACGCLSGPTGLAGLSVRTWVCVQCGTAHDRDQNAAINTLMAGVGTTLERDLRRAA